MALAGEAVQSIRISRILRAVIVKVFRMPAWRPYPRVPTTGVRNAPTKLQEVGRDR